MMMTSPKNEKIAASFRDPSGFLFKQDGVLYRQVNKSYQQDFDLLIQSGLYERLTEKGQLIPHIEVEQYFPADSQIYKIIQPEIVPFISYPYEWCFSQLKDAALLTLTIQKKAIKAGMSLKDASAYNIQFHHGKPIFIDTLSFEKYREGEPWTAYRQFCQHFLAPLALMSLVDVRLSQLLRVYIDGLPLDLASKLLPFKTRLNFSLGTHLHMHAKTQERYSGKNLPVAATSKKSMSRHALLGLIDHLAEAVKKLEWKPVGTEWAEYYDQTNYTDRSLQQKAHLVDLFLQKVQPKSLWDLGANTGFFSRIASQKGVPTIAFDLDPAAVEKNYRECKKGKEAALLPLVLDLTNPSPALGWENRERMSLAERGPVDCVMALALIHHLVISNNVPLPRLAAFFASLANWLIIEFVPKSDSQVQKLLSTRKDIFLDYHPEGFERSFGECFQIIDKQAISGTHRILYLLQRA